MNLLLGIVILLGCVSAGTGLAATTQANPASFGDQKFTIRVGGHDRAYIVHVPPGYDGKSSVPVVVMLHGGGGTGNAAAIETGWGVKADEVGFLAVFPDATEYMTISLESVGDPRGINSLAGKQFSPRWVEIFNRTLQQRPELTRI